MILNHIYGFWLETIEEVKDDGKQCVKNTIKSVMPEAVVAHIEKMKELQDTAYKQNGYLLNDYNGEVNAAEGFIDAAVDFPYDLITLPITLDQLSYNLKTRPGEVKQAFAGQVLNLVSDSRKVNKLKGNLTFQGTVILAAHAAPKVPMPKLLKTEIKLPNPGLKFSNSSKSGIMLMELDAKGVQFAKVAPVSDAFTVSAHSMDKTKRITMILGNGEKMIANGGDDLLKFLQSNTLWDGKKPLRLLICDAASSGLAQEMSNGGARVIEATEAVWANEGVVFSAAKQGGKAAFPPNGKWLIFENGKVRPLTFGEAKKFGNLNISNP